MEGFDDAKGSLAAAYAALNQNYEMQRMQGYDQTRSKTLSDVARTYADTTSGASGKKHQQGSSDSESPHPSRGTYGGNGMGKFLETEDLEKLNMLAAAQKVAAYHVQQSPMLTVVRPLHQRMLSAVDMNARGICGTRLFSFALYFAAACLIVSFLLECMSKCDVYQIPSSAEFLWYVFPSHGLWCSDGPPPR